jgi:peptide/nickel transport system permease protein
MSILSPDTQEALAPAATSNQQHLSRRKLIRRRFFRNKLAVFGLFSIVALFILAFGGPYISAWSYQDLDFNNFLMPPSAEHWFGTTQIGGDVFTLTMRGLQKSLIIGLLVAVFSTGLAAIVGATAGYLGGRLDRSLMWVVDLLLVLPSFLIIAILSPLYRGKTWLLYVVLLAAFSWMITARIIRGMAMSLRERDFVRAARYMGVPTWKIIFRHLLPNMSSILIIDATLNVGGAILGESALSFFGFGIQPPDVSLGSLIADGTGSALTYPWLFMFAGGLLVLAVLSVSFIGDGLRDALDPGATGGARK